jgi:hypothetical protein
MADVKLFSATVYSFPIDTSLDKDYNISNMEPSEFINIVTVIIVISLCGLIFGAIRYFLGVPINISQDAGKDIMIASGIVLGISLFTRLLLVFFSREQ